MLVSQMDLKGGSTVIVLLNAVTLALRADMTYARWALRADMTYAR